MTGENLPVSPAVLTKRELIAAMCLQGYLANPHPKIMAWSNDIMACASIKQADDLLKKLYETTGH